ncbi:nuclease-related domain-containing protein [Paludicola sp. MB14-C6]|uniref:nuclease-related domain-containing protein n=1 Tax=Paludihabitans sp. MB14-C6 TaxID=3070656 RepID=UPI0027DC7A33|nr:nuclease-related domain-containing protein [Paludicola sp. MB14-C6]WMJ22469.1 nuclease-related domain-containing protein [Paludicola sp. MB14-C6]
MIYYIIGGTVILSVLIIMLTAFIRKRKIIKIGKDGEKKVASTLKKYAGIRGYKVINDLYLPLYDKTTQIDHVLIGFFGIIVVETKNLSGEIYGDPKKKDWLHIMGEKKHTLYNPLMQNQTHIDCIRHLLGKENIYNVNIESLVVFSARKVTLFVPNKLPIIYFKKFKKYLKQPCFEKDNDIDIQKVYNALMKYKVTDKKLIAEHNKNVKIMAKNNK